jgi:F-type H+-transporting ATPase subunit b
MEKREEYMDDLKKDVVKSEQKMEELKEQMRKRETTVRLEAEEIKTELTASGNKAASEIFAGIRSEIEGLKSENEKEIKSQLISARQDVIAEVEQLAVDIMERVLNRRLVQ